MTKFFLAATWAIAMLVLALLARIGWVARDTATLLLLVMPMIAFTTLQRGGGCRAASREA